MFKDESATLVYACHVLEYFDRLEVVDVLREWHRVLAHGGVVRLAVPDFAALAEVYRRHRDVARVSGRSTAASRFPPKAGRGCSTTGRSTTSKASRPPSRRWASGTCRRWDWRRTEHAGHDDFSQAYVPHMDKEHGLLISLNVEADK